LPARLVVKLLSFPNQETSDGEASTKLGEGSVLA
jgi:hypothetical protein